MCSQAHSACYIYENEREQFRRNVKEANFKKPAERKWVQEEEKTCRETWIVKCCRSYKEFRGGFPERLDVFQERGKQSA